MPRSSFSAPLPQPFRDREGRFLLAPLFERGFKKLKASHSLPLTAEINHGGADEDRSLGFLRFETETFTVALTACGHQTGLGVIHKERVEIPCFGPHFAPLGDEKGFGIFRPSTGSYEGFRDLTYFRIGESRGLKGWTKMMSPDVKLEGSLRPEDQPSRSEWFYFEVSGNQEKMEISVLQTVDRPKDQLYFAFFILADQATVDGKKRVIPGGLQRYRGEASEVQFEKGESSLKLLFKERDEIEIIPLAGGDHFWSADFLLAIPFDKRMHTYRWTLQ